MSTMYKSSEVSRLSKSHNSQIDNEPMSILELFNFFTIDIINFLTVVFIFCFLSLSLLLFRLETNDYELDVRRAGCDQECYVTPSQRHIPDMYGTSLHVSLHNSTLLKFFDITLPHIPAIFNTPHIPDIPWTVQYVCNGRRMVCNVDSSLPSTRTFLCHCRPVS